MKTIVAIGTLLSFVIASNATAEPNIRGDERTRIENEPPKVELPAVAIANVEIPDDKPEIRPASKRKTPARPAPARSFKSYARALGVCGNFSRRGIDVANKATLTFEVDERGRARKVAVNVRDRHAKKVERCIALKVAEWRLPNERPGKKSFSMRVRANGQVKLVRRSTAG